MSYHGVLLIDKEPGMTSHDVVARLRKILNMKSIGHSGTLDPLASGLMAILLGEGTKLSHYILEQDKAYIVKAKLGVQTDTLDITGQVLKECPILQGPEEVKRIALNLIGEMEVPVPIFSATKVDGKKLYEYAREEKSVEIPIKKMNFFGLQILTQSDSTIEVLIKCTKGSFIRSWVDLLGQKLGCGATVAELRRTESAPYKIENAVTLDKLDQYLKSSHFEHLPAYIPMSSTLSEMPVLRVQGQDQVMIGNGLISHQLKNQLIALFRPEMMSDPTAVIKILSQKESLLLALIGLEPGKGFVFRRVFRY